MNQAQNQCLKLCQELLTSSGYNEDDFKVKNYQIEDEETVLELSSSTFDIVFRLRSVESDGGNLDSDLFYFEEENCITYIENVTIGGYSCAKCNEINEPQVSLLLTNLAKYHSKIIAQNGGIQKFCETNICSYAQNEKMQDIAYQLALATSNAIIDINLFKEGIKKLTDNYKAKLQPVEGDLYVNESIFERKICFKTNSDECIQLKSSRKTRHISVIYDMLCGIYFASDQKWRQRYFHETTNNYYHTLRKELSEVNVDLDLYMSFEEYERKIKLFIPYVKLDLVFFLINELLRKEIGVKENVKDLLNAGGSYKDLMCEAMSELCEYILAPKINREDCYRIVSDAIGSNYDHLSYELTQLDGLAGLLGEYYKLRISVQQEGKHKTFDLFAKFLPRELPSAGEAHVFLKEEFFYSVFVPALRNLGLSDIANFLPKSYFVRPRDVIVLEDMYSLDYKTMDCKQAFSYKSLLLAVKQLARMHACSLLYEEITTKKRGREVRIDQDFDKYFNDMDNVQNEFVEAMHNCGVNAIVNIVYDHFPDIPKKISMEVFRNRSRKLFDLMCEKMKSSKVYRNVICHGDIWSGNIMFKFDGNNPLDCSLIDYQLIRYCPPTHDLLALLYINSDQATRTLYMSHLIDEYYKELSSIFKRYDFDLSTIYSYDHFKDCCTYMKSHAVCFAALFYPCSLDRDKVQGFLQDPQQKLDFFLVDKTAVLQELMKDDRIRSRFREIVEELYDLCLNME